MNSNFDVIHIKNRHLTSKIEKMVNRIIAGMLLVFLTGIAALAQNEPKTSQTLVSLGMKVPGFKYEASKGKSASINDLKGKLVLINFFATWCGPCKVELPKIQAEIWNKHHANPKFVMLTFGREHNWSEVYKFKQDNGFQFAFYPDPTRGVYGKFATQLIPRSFLIDEDGKIIYMSEGFDENHFNELVKLIDSKL